MAHSPILVTGTLAIDHIARVADGFQAGDLNGKLHAPSAHWGGCGMNLAYGLARANVAAVPWVFYGDDCPPDYLQHIEQQGISQRAMHRQTDADCAAAYIFSRDDGSQLTGFYPGSTRFEAPSPDQKQAIRDCQIWIAGPEDDDTLLQRLPHINVATTLFWMPGQYAEVTRNNVLVPMLERRPNLIVNAKEWSALQQAVGKNELIERVGAVFITQGAAGVEYRESAEDRFHHNSTTSVPATDPTGCGDAFCAALIANLTKGVAVSDAVDHAQAQAALCLMQMGSQHY